MTIFILLVIHIPKTCIHIYIYCIILYPIVSCLFRLWDHHLLLLAAPGSWRVARDFWHFMRCKVITINKLMGYVY